MLNFGASKPRVKGGPGPLGPPLIRACYINNNITCTLVISLTLPVDQVFELELPKPHAKSHCLL